jgi:hypothetical protein
MPESAPSRGRTSTQRSPGPARDSSRSAGSPQVQVRYYRRMRPNKVYPFTVSWRESARGAGPVTVRLVLAGAQVVPAEQTLDPANPDDRVTFYVTPLAKGWLRGERLELLQNGRKVQEIRLPCKVTTQRATWLFLLLTIFVGWWVVPLIVEEIREPMLPRPGPGRPGLAAVREKFKDLPPDVQRMYPYLYYLIANEQEASELQFNKRQAMEIRLARNSPPVLPAIKNHLPKEVTRELESINGHIGDGLYILHSWEADGIPIAEGLLGGLILLTLLSWLLHLERRKWRVGRPLPAAAGEGES